MKTILFPSDFSLDADNALVYAINLSKQTNSQLVVFYSMYIPETFPKKEYNKTVEKDILFKQTMLESLVAELCKKHKIQVPEDVIYEVKNQNSVVENILSVAKKYKADLIVVGTHGTTGLRKVLFGSTTAGLILKSTIPVLAIPKGFSYVKIKNMVYASDMKNLSKELAILEPISNDIGAEMEVLYLDYWGDSKEKKLLFDKTISKKKLTNIRFAVKAASMEKTIAEHIKNYMRKHDDSILVMFPEQTNFFEKIFFKSITEKISVKLNKPLLSIRKTAK